MIRRVLASGALASAASAAAAFACSQQENGHAARPINAITHILDGGEPPAHDGENRRNTALGLAIHTGACVFWAVIFEAMFGRRAGQSVARAAVAGTTTAATAYVVDYYVVQPRFRPGIECYLSRRALFCVYAALGIGFAAGALLTARPIRPRAAPRRLARRRAAEPA